MIPRNSTRNVTQLSTTYIQQYRQADQAGIAGLVPAVQVEPHLSFRDPGKMRANPKKGQDKELDVSLDCALHIVQHDLLVRVPPALRSKHSLGCGNLGLRFYLQEQFSHHSVL